MKDNAEKKHVPEFTERPMEVIGQVEKGNRASLCLQRKLGMTQSGNLIVWMWR